MISENSCILGLLVRIIAWPRLYDIRESERRHYRWPASKEQSCRYSPTCGHRSQAHQTRRHHNMQGSLTVWPSVVKRSLIVSEMCFDLELLPVLVSERGFPSLIVQELPGVDIVADCKHDGLIERWHCTQSAVIRYCHHPSLPVPPLRVNGKWLWLRLYSVCLGKWLCRRRVLKS